MIDPRVWREPEVSDMMTRLDEIEARLIAAPPGPYEWEGPVPSLLSSLGAYILRASGDGWLEAPGYEWPEMIGLRELIAHLPDDLRYLLERVRRAEAERDRLRGYIQYALDGPDDDLTDGRAVTVIKRILRDVLGPPRDNGTHGGNGDPR